MLANEISSVYWGSNNELCTEENLNNDEVKKVIDTYIYDERNPLPNNVAEALNEQPKFLERRKIISRVLDKIVGFVEKFYDDIGTSDQVNDFEDKDLLVAEVKPVYN